MVSFAERSGMEKRVDMYVQYTPRGILSSVVGEHSSVEVHHVSETRCGEKL
jgi:hypothetical protein